MVATQTLILIVLSVSFRKQIEWGNSSPNADPVSGMESVLLQGWCDCSAGDPENTYMFLERASLIRFSGSRWARCHPQKFFNPENTYAACLELAGRTRNYQARQLTGTATQKAG